MALSSESDATAFEAGSGLLSEQEANSEKSANHPNGFERIRAS
jgi:hypothetical protein